MKLQPVMRTDEHHLEKHELILRMNKEKRPDVVFLGDSLTRRWEDNLSLWNEYFEEYNPANFGVGGDCIENVLWRVTNGQIDGINPRLFFVLIGTNNLWKDSEEEIVEGIIEIVRVIHSKCTQSRVVVFGLLPREKDEGDNECKTRIDSINRWLRERARENDYTYEYFGDVLLTQSGLVDKEIMPDGLHLNEAGYRVVGPHIRQIIEKYIETPLEKI